MLPRLLLPLFSLAWISSTPALLARDLAPKPADPELAKFEVFAAPPAPAALLLKKGDRLAICGDSITEQKMYSRILETYLTVALPELEITCRQFGWSGERADGFLARMKDDCLRFQPTIATTCYGMNDHAYRPYEESIGAKYRTAQTAVVDAFKNAGCRVILGTAGPVGKMPSWVKSATGTVEDLNLSLCKLRNLDLEIAESENAGFADIFWPMFLSGLEARKRLDPGYNIAGADGVHPGWAGHTVMAYAFLKALGVRGDIGTFTVDLGANTATASTGHEVLGFANGEVKLRSSRYPFCAEGGDPKKDDNIRSAMGLVPFNEELNRLLLVVKNAPANGAAITWGTETRDYSQADLEKGVNLAADFPANPFSGAFKAVWEAVGAKQNYETRQVKELFRSPEAAADREGLVAVTEKTRAPFAAKIKEALRPVEHTLRIQAK